jgi:AsmA-like C-terminal region
MLGGVDAALEARIERLTWRGFRLQDIAVDGRSVGGQLTLHHLSLHDAEDTKADLTGALDLRRRTFDLSGTARTVRPLQLLRGLGMTPPLMLARLTPITLSGTAQGDLDAFDVALELRHADARLALKGRIRSPPEGPWSYALAVDGSDPDYRQLLDRMGIVVAAAGPAPAPLDLTAKLTGDLATKASVVGTAQLGAMSLTGQVDWQQGTPRPKLVVRLSAGKPNADDLASLAAVAGLRPDPVVTRGLRGGAWSGQPLAFGWLNAADAEVELSAKGGLVGPSVELQARLDQGRLMVDRLSGTLWGGKLDAQVSLDGARKLPFLALALDLRAIDSKALAAWLDLPPVVGGKADLYVEATTAGNDVRDLVRGLIGEAKVGLHDGHLVGADLARLAAAPAPGSGAPFADGAALGAPPPEVVVPSLSGSFALKRGIATAAGVSLKLADTPVKVEGTIDLLLWAADLTLSVVPDGAAADDVAKLRLVGPLDRPQLRLRQPAPVLPPPAP